MAKTVLFVGGGIETLPGVRLAKSMGMKVVVSDRDPRAPCFAEADATLVADVYDPGATLKAVSRFVARAGPLHGALCLAVDAPATAAAVTAAYGLPGVSPQTAALAMDKLAMKRRLRDRGVPVPWFASLASAEDLASQAARQPFPLVIKPVDSRGARGVMRVTDDLDLAWAFDYARRCSPTGRVMAERFLSGPQVSTESLMVDGAAYTPGFSDRNYEWLDRYAPFFIENGGDLPSFLPAADQDALKEVAAAAARALGIRDGVAKGDLVLSEGKPYVIEIAARLSGGYFCTHSIPLNTGVALVRWALAQAVGDPVDPAELIPKRQRCVCQRYLFPEPGKVLAVRGVEAVAARPEIAYCETRVRPGDTVGPIENHPGRAGVLMATGETREAARRHAERAVRDIEIVTG